MRARRREMPLVGSDTITVPGAVAGWEVLPRSGRLALRDMLRSAVDAARFGIPVAAGLARALVAGESNLRTDTGMSAVFFADGGPLREGDLLVQSALADTIEHIAEEGAETMYESSPG